MLPAGHPHLVPAPAHEPQVTKLIEQADSTLVIGSDLDAMDTMNWALAFPRPRVAINVDRADATKNYELRSDIRHASEPPRGGGAANSRQPRTLVR